MKVEELLKDLTQIKSYSGQEEELANYLIGFANKHQIPYEAQEGNVVMKFIGNSSKCLIFNAHMDTVKAGDLKDWQYPPFGKKAGVVKDGKLYGLGASDAKASIVALILLAVELVQSRPACEVWLTFVTEEETTGSGTKNFLNWFNKKYRKGYQEIAVILTEPTDLKAMEVGHRGNVFIKVRIKGDSGHSAYPDKVNKNAVLSMIDLVRKMNKLNERVKKEYKDDNFGIPTITLTDIKCNNSSVNTIPSVCTATWDIRTTPQFHVKTLDVISEELGRDTDIELIGKPVPCSLTDKDEKILSLFKKIIPNLSIKIAPSSNDSYFFNKCGIPTVTFGPGQKETIHKPNEYVIIENVLRAANIYHNLVDRFA